MTTTRYIRFGVVGIHGFSRSHIHSLRQLEPSGARVKLVAAVAHAREQDETYASSLETAGVKLVPDLDSLLALRNEVDVVTLPVGIALHVPMAVKALHAGYAVYVEKPVTGAIQDFDHLAEVERQTPGPLFVGFQDLFQPSIWEFKQRLLKQELGALRRVVVMAAWGRATSYYQRNAWAGRLTVDGAVVLDSPLNNACAHYMNLALFLAGSSLRVSACPQEVTAELYRAYPIESADTTAVRVSTCEGVDIVFAASHACETARGPLFRLECDNGVITNERDLDSGKWGPWHLRYSSGAEQQTEIQSGWVNPFDHVARYLQGEKDLPICTLAMSRPHTLVVNGAHLSSPIRVIPPAYFRTKVEQETTETYRCIKDMNELLESCFEKGCLFSETGAARLSSPKSAPWAQAGKPVEVAGLRFFP